MENDRKTNVSSIPTWNGAKATRPRYIAKIKVLAIYHEDAVRRIAHQMNINITRGERGRCKHCARSKAKQNIMSRESQSKKVTEVYEQIYLDLSKVTVPKKDGTTFDINKKHWRSVVDEKTGKKWCDFTATKKEMLDQMCQWLNSMQARGFKVKIIRLDPVGENGALRSAL